MQDGERVISTTYNELNESGEIIKRNAKDSFYAVDPELKAALDVVERYIDQERLGEGCE